MEVAHSWHMKLITRDDVLCCGLSIYHIERKILENDEIFQDGTHIIYVNSKKQEDTELGRLMHDLHCKDAKDMHHLRYLYQILRQSVLG